MIYARGLDKLFGKQYRSSICLTEPLMIVLPCVTFQKTTH